MRWRVTDRSTKTGTSDPTLNATAQAPMALRPKDAAKTLGIGRRLLWSLTNRGEIPHVRLGRAIVYPRAALEEWLMERAKRGGRNL